MEWSGVKTTRGKTPAAGPAEEHVVDRQEGMDSTGTLSELRESKKDERIASGITPEQWTVVLMGC